VAQDTKIFGFKILFLPPIHLLYMYSKEEIKLLRKEFWDTFGRRCEIVPELKGRRKKWLLHRTGIPNVDLKFEAGRNDAKVILEVNHRSESQRLKTFEILERYKVLLEEGFEDGLIWDFCYLREDSGQMVCRIYTIQTGVDFHKRAQWPEIYNFFIANMLRLQRNFLEIKDMVRHEILNYLSV